MEALGSLDTSIKCPYLALTALEYINEPKLAVLDNNLSYCKRPVRRWELRPKIQRLNVTGMFDILDGIVEGPDRLPPVDNYSVSQADRPRRLKQKFRAKAACPDCNNHECKQHKGVLVQNETEWIVKKKSVIHGYGIFAKKFIAQGMDFGPFKGEKTKEPPEDDTYCWEITCKDLSRLYIDGTSERSNWMKYVNAARDIDEFNVFRFLYNDEIYYRTVRSIPSGTELLISYGENRPYMVKPSEVDKFMKSRVEHIRKQPPAVVLD